MIEGFITTEHEGLQCYEMKSGIGLQYAQSRISPCGLCAHAVWQRDVNGAVDEIDSVLHFAEGTGIQQKIISTGDTTQDFSALGIQSNGSIIHDLQVRVLYLIDKLKPWNYISAPDINNDYRGQFNGDGTSVDSYDIAYRSDFDRIIFDPSSDKSVLFRRYVDVERTTGGFSWNLIPATDMIGEQVYGLQRYGDVICKENIDDILKVLSRIRYVLFTPRNIPSTTFPDTEDFIRGLRMRYSSGLSWDNKTCIDWQSEAENSWELPDKRYSDMFDFVPYYRDRTYFVMQFNVWRQYGAVWNNTESGGFEGGFAFTRGLYLKTAGYSPMKREARSWILAFSHKQEGRICYPVYRNLHEGKYTTVKRNNQFKWYSQNDVLIPESEYFPEWSTGSSSQPTPFKDWSVHDACLGLKDPDDNLLPSLHICNLEIDETLRGGQYVSFALVLEYEFADHPIDE